MQQGNRMQGRLNIFQKTMLQWSEMHPYNAVHVARIPEPLDTTRLNAVIDRFFEVCGLNSLSLDKTKGRYHYDGGPYHHQVKVVRMHGDEASVLEDEVEFQLNTPFPSGPSVIPIRFFVIGGTTHFHLGLAYSHFVSGADSIVFILKNIVNMYMGRNEPQPPVTINLYPGRYRTLFRMGPRALLGWLTTLPASVKKLRRAFRPRYRNIDDHANGLLFFSLDPSHLDKLVRTSRLWGVTLNDIFLGILLKAVSPLAEGRFRAVRRQNISVASIANIRRDLGIPDDRTFGLFLGFLTVTHPVPEATRLQDIVMDVHEQTARIKKHRLYLRAPLELGLARLLMRRLTTDRQRRFYQKYYPLWGGITNVNLNTLWEQSSEETPVDYVRAVSTGPVCPLVLSITTVRDVINIGLSFRKTAFSGQDAKEIAAGFSGAIDSLEVLV